MDTLHEGMSTRNRLSTPINSHGIHIIGRKTHVDSRWPSRICDCKICLNNQLTIFQRLQHINLYEPVCLPNEFWWGIWNLTPRVQGRCPAAVREVKHLTTNQCLEGAGIQWFSPWFNSFLWKIACYHTRHRTWRNIRWHRPPFYVPDMSLEQGWVDYCKQLERFQGWSWHSHVFCWDGIDTLGPSEIPKWVSLLLIFAELDGFYTHCYSAVTGPNSSR